MSHPSLRSSFTLALVAMAASPVAMMSQNPAENPGNRRNDIVPAAEESIRTHFAE